MTQGRSSFVDFVDFSVFNWWISQKNQSFLGSKFFIFPDKQAKYYILALEGASHPSSKLIVNIFSLCTS